MQKSTTLKGLLAVSAVVAMFSTAGVQAQTQPSVAQKDAAGQTGSNAKLSAGDEKAVKDMAQANINEIAAAKIALNKAKSSDVKAFAQKMVDDHGAALTKVQTVAEQKGVTLPTEPDAMHKAMAAKLEKMSGDAFDKAYMAQGGLAAHKETLAKLQKGQKGAKDPDVQAQVTKMIPVVEQHLQHAQELAGAKKSGSSGTTGSSHAGM